MRYVIIGGAGFLGLELVRQLQEKNASLIVLDIVKPSSDVEFEYCDITKPLEFKFLKDDVVIHLAANQYHHKVPRKNRREFFENVNVAGTKNILDKMLLDGAKNMVFFSTDMVYGKPQELPVKITHQLAPFGFYGQSKALAEKVCREFRDKGFNITIFRPRMIIGKGRLGILEKLFKLMDFNLPVPTIGSGNNCYQMVAVADCASATILAVEKECPNKEFNLGSKNPPKVKDLLKNVARRAGSKSLIVPTWGKAVKLTLALLGKIGLEIMYKEQYMIADENYLIDISQTEKELGWHPKFNDTDMLLDAYQMYKQANK